MTTSFNTAVSGVIARQQAVDVTANNMANLSTQGYKADQVSFSDLLRTNIHAPDAPSSDLNAGHGTRVLKTDTLFTAGPMQQTGRALDYALTDDRTFFAVRTAGGDVEYTRDGNFELSQQADGSFILTDTQGNALLGADGNPVTAQNGQAASQIGVFTFANLDGLNKTGGDQYAATADSGQAQAVADAGLKQGYLEGSAADLATEMSNLITQSRDFSLSAKLVTMSDEVMQTINNLR